MIIQGKRLSYFIQISTNKLVSIGLPNTNQTIEYLRSTVYIYPDIVMDDAAVSPDNISPFQLANNSILECKFFRMTDDVVRM